MIKTSSSLNYSDITYRSDKLLRKTSNRYRLTVQVANHAKRRLHQEIDSCEDPLMKPTIRAIIEMSDELTQKDILEDDKEYTLKSAKNDIIQNSSDNVNYYNLNQSEQSLSVAIVKQRETHKQNDNILSNLNQLQSNCDLKTWSTFNDLINCHFIRLDLEKAKKSAKKLKLNYKTKKPYSVAHTLIIQKAFQAATVDIVKSVPHTEVISGFINDKLQTIPCAEYIISRLATVKLQSITKLCVEMVYQIAVVYDKDWQGIEQKEEILIIFGLALISEKALEAGITLLKCGNVMNMALSASAKALMILAIGNAACIYYENYDLALSGKLDRLMNIYENYLEGITNKSAVENLIEKEIKYEFSINYTQIENYLKEKVSDFSLK